MVFPSVQRGDEMFKRIVGYGRMRRAGGHGSGKRGIEMGL
jgi:hypothetical protein